MFDFFVTESLVEPNMDMLGEMFDQRYRERELPDDLFSMFIPQGISQQDDYFINKEYSEIDDIECSRIEKIVMSDDPKEDFIIEVGPKNMDRPHIYIEPDYIPGLVTLKWYMEFMMSKDPVMLPYIEVAKMNIPASAEEVQKPIKMFDVFFSQKEALIFGPTYSFTQENPSDKYVVADIEEEANIMMNTKMQLHAYRFVFSSKYPFRASTLNYPYRFAWMEFNPYHPLAPRLMQSYKIQGSVMTGTYRSGRKLKDFSFDKNDKKYRIHSEQWQALFPIAHRYMAVFDLVSNFDIVGAIPELYGHHYKMSKYDGRYVELYQLKNNKITTPYSPMINERGRGEGMENYYYSYSSSYPIQISDREGETYYDVTNQYELIIGGSLEYDARIERRNTRVVLARIRVGSSDRFIEEGYFVYFTLKGHLEVFVSSKFKDKEDIEPIIEVKKILLQDVFYSNMARNREGTLINPIGVVDYDTFFRETREFSLIYLDSMPTDIEGMFMDPQEESLENIESKIEISDYIEGEEIDGYDQTYENQQKESNLLKIKQGTFLETLHTWIDDKEFEGMTRDLNVPNITLVERRTPGVLLPEVLRPNSESAKILTRNKQSGLPKQESRIAAVQQLQDQSNKSMMRKPKVKQKNSVMRFNKNKKN